MSVADESAHPIGEEDLLRARLYALLARVLATVPTAPTLESLQALEGDASPLGLALNELAAAARIASPETVDDEYHALFIGVAGGELSPYGSYYLTGFMYEKPLADLRGDMARLGIARVDKQSKDPEDHIAALCEMMAGLITGGLGAGPAPLDEQQAFFDRHVGSWAQRFFTDLERAENARFFRPVGKIGRLFMAIEQQAFELAA